MTTQMISTIAAGAMAAVRVSHYVHAVTTIQHDWTAIAHGAIPIEAIFAIYVLFEAVMHIARTVRTGFEKQRRRGEEAPKEVLSAQDESAASPTTETR